jgi:hypothetical protein
MRNIITTHRITAGMVANKTMHDKGIDKPSIKKFRHGIGKIPIHPTITRIARRQQ